MPALALPEQVTPPALAFWGRLDVKPKFWPCPRGSVCLMILIWPQFAISRCSISMSSGFEVKLDPDVRDSHTSCGNALQPVNPRTFVRLTPNSANCCATRAVLSIPLLPAVMADWFEHPSTSLAVVLLHPPTVIPL